MKNPARWTGLRWLAPLGLGVIKMIKLTILCYLC